MIDAFNGVYHAMYWAEGGSGFAYFRIAEGKLAGFDIGGGCYTANVFENSDGTITLEIQMTVPPEGQLVGGQAQADIPYTRHFPLTIPRDFASGRSFEVIVPPGMVNLVVHRVTDAFGVWADQGFEITTRTRAA